MQSIIVDNLCARKIGSLTAIINLLGNQGIEMTIILHVLLMSVTKPGGRLNKKDGLTRYGDSHVKDKTS